MELGATAGVKIVTLPALNDGISGAIDVPIGFVMGNSTQTAVYVSGLHLSLRCSLSVKPSLSIIIAYRLLSLLIWQDRSFAFVMIHANLGILL